MNMPFMERASQKKNDRWYKVAKYYFSITHKNDKRFLHIYKPKENGI